MLKNLKEDIEQYDLTISTYDNLEPEDVELAYDLAKQSLVLANRWNEIMVDSAKYCTLIGVKKSQFENYAYHKYRILMTVHEFCRVVRRQGKEEYRNGFINET